MFLGSPHRWARTTPTRHSHSSSVLALPGGKPPNPPPISSPLLPALAPASCERTRTTPQQGSARRCATSTPPSPAPPAAGERPRVTSTLHHILPGARLHNDMTSLCNECTMQSLHSAITPPTPPTARPLLFSYPGVNHCPPAEPRTRRLPAPPHPMLAS